MGESYITVRYITKDQILQIGSDKDLRKERSDAAAKHDFAASSVACRYNLELHLWLVILNSR
jgi:hypothetical protein